MLREIIKIIFYKFLIPKHIYIFLKTKKFKKQFCDLSALSKRTTPRFHLSLLDLQPCLNEDTANTSFDPHYIYHPAWAARVLAKTLPKKHVDISSTLHFSTLVSAFLEVDFYDYRPANIFLNNFKSYAADLNCLPFASNSIESLSCMHVVEHIGLGRYGDSLDYDGDLKAIDELKRVVTPMGDLLFVVPVGKSKIAFNAHRIYAYDQVISYFRDWKLMDYALIPDNGITAGMKTNIDNKFLSDEQNYGCGCFWFKKN